MTAGEADHWPSAMAKRAVAHVTSMRLSRGWGLRCLMPDRTH
ncbi:protein of unknown function [Nocardia cyriacigeorgica GUH-2]|uniref:Uncharacterized protein n=1 Tax=Nocardia cyriacigeorgica (strain GUH-2) TaxID=1127134 RepID=H6QZ67_NOCCG|nr:protein of unknown function [Nocardia cyriacigeorgica GUH-2]